MMVSFLSGEARKNGFVHPSLVRVILQRGVCSQPSTRSRPSPNFNIMPTVADVDERVCRAENQAILPRARPNDSIQAHRLPLPHPFKRQFDLREVRKWEKSQRVQGCQACYRVSQVISGGPSTAISRRLKRLKAFTPILALDVDQRFLVLFFFLRVGRQVRGLTITPTKKSAAGSGGFRGKGGMLAGLSKGGRLR